MDKNVKEVLQSMKEEPQTAARTIGRISREKVTRRGCIWPELRERYEDEEESKKKQAMPVRTNMQR